jgi:DNA-binding beta-propeller fold protein YncE
MRQRLGLIAAAALIALAAAGCARNADKAERASAFAMTPVWRVTGLASPESVLLSADAGFFYVSNVNGDGEVKDGNGFISRISRDGIMLERQWAVGLDAPKGMALKGGKLYVADITVLRIIDAATGKVEQSLTAPGAGFLNDVAILPDGAVIVSDSGGGSVYRLDGSQLTLWLKTPELRSANGLLPANGKLYITTMQGLLLEADPATKAIRKLAEGLGQADGLARLNDGSFLVGEWPGRLFHVTVAGKVSAVADTRDQNVYLNDFLVTDDLTRRVLIAPQWKPGSLTEFDISPPPTR